VEISKPELANSYNTFNKHMSYMLQ